MACLKCHFIKLSFFNWPERLNFIHGKKWAELVTEYWQMTKQQRQRQQHKSHNLKILK